MSDILYSSSSPLMQERWEKRLKVKLFNMMIRLMWPNPYRRPVKQALLPAPRVGRPVRP